MLVRLRHQSVRNEFQRFHSGIEEHKKMVHISPTGGLPVMSNRDQYLLQLSFNNNNIISTFIDLFSAYRIWSLFTTRFSSTKFDKIQFESRHRPVCFFLSTKRTPAINSVVIHKMRIPWTYVTDKCVGDICRPRWYMNLYCTEVCAFLQAI